MTTIEFVVPMVPVPWARAGGHGKARFTKPKQAKAAQDLVLLAAQHKPRQPIDGPVWVALRFYLPIPRSWSNVKRELALDDTALPTSKPDLDNLVKLVLDALTRSGQWWLDDAQVVEISARKVYGNAPRISVAVWYR